MSFIEFCAGICVGISLLFSINHQYIESVWLCLAGAILLFIDREVEKGE